MRKFLLMSCVAATALLANGASFANDELIALSKDPKQWVMPTGDYANRRFSELDQINSENVKISSRLGASRLGCCAATRAGLSSSAT